MKILFYNYAMNMGGIERTIAGLANLLSEEHEVIVSQFLRDDSFYELGERVRFEPFGFTASGNVVMRTLRLYRRIRALLKKERPDIVFCMSLTHLVLFCRAARGLDTVVVGAESANPLNDMSRRAVEQRARSVYADGFIFQTERARTAYPEKTVRVSTVIANAIWNEDVLNSPETLPEKKKRVVSVGRLEYVKGYDFLIEAFSRVAADFPEWELVIYGEGTEREKLEKQIKALNMEDRIRLPGRDLHAFRHVRASEIFVLSSRSEGMPNTLLEAMACGVCAIAVDCPNGPREIVTDGVDGLLIESESVSALEEALCKAMGDASLRAQLSKRAKDILEAHTPAWYASAWLDYAREVISRKRG